MSKEQKHLKPCYILDRLREWFELYGNQNHQRAEEELHLAIDELYEYQQKDKQLADLQQEQIKEMQEHQEAMELADKTIKATEEQNKRVLEKLELIVSANQELEKENMELSSKVDLLESEKENLFRTLEETGEELAEKEKKIESLITDLQKALALIKEGREIVDLNDKALERTDQDKISFAVEQLEKVPIIQEINNQIKQLKEME